MDLQSEAPEALPRGSLLGHARSSSDRGRVGMSLSALAPCQVQGNLQGQEGREGMHQRRFGGDSSGDRQAEKTGFHLEENI